MLEPGNRRVVFAATSFLCYKWHDFLLDPSRNFVATIGGDACFCYNQHDDALVFFALRLFCWNQCFLLLELANVFDTIDHRSFLLLGFLLEPLLSFAGSGKYFCFNGVPKFFVTLDFFCWR